MSSRQGFTLIEILVILAISTLLSTIAITYSKAGQSQVFLSVEVAKISQLMLQAKQLSIATYGSSFGACGYGVMVDAVNQTYSLFAYVPASSPPCPHASSITGIGADEIQPYALQSWSIHVANGVVLQLPEAAPDSLQMVLFYPPSPTTFISRDGRTFLSPGETSKVYLKTSDGNGSAAVTVNPAGQVEL